MSILEEAVIAQMSDTAERETVLDLVRAYEKGLLAKLPCKYGDVLYAIMDSIGVYYVVECTVSETTLQGDEFYFSVLFKQPCEYCKSCDNGGDYYDEHTEDIKNGYCMIEWGGGQGDSFGERVFYTKESADAKLAAIGQETTR